MLHTLRLPFLAIVFGASVVGAQEQRPDSSDMLKPNRVGPDVGAVGATLGLPLRERGVSISVIDSTSGALSTAPSLPVALQARLPGVSVSLGEGILGSSSRVWLRGPSGLIVNEPLLIIDGARTHTPSPDRFFIARELPSRLEDIDMETVERVEVLRGPAAAAIYGPGASKGVILLTTKRGRPGRARWTAFAESGPSHETTDFPANFGTLGVATAGGAPVANCPLAQQAAGSCIPVSRHSWNPLESASPFRTGWTNGAGVTVSGSAGLLTYFVGGSHDRAEGVYENDQSRATSARVSLSAAPASGVQVSFTGAHRVDDLRHPGESWLAAGLFGASVDDPVRRGYSGAGYPRLSRLARDEDVRRTTLSLNTTWDPRPWLRTTAVVGYDRLGVNSDLTERVGAFPPGDSATTVNRSKDLPQARTAAVAATASYLVRGMAARSSVGIQYVRDDDRGRSFDAFIPDDGGPSAATESMVDLRRTSTGVYVQQHFGWNDRLFLTGSLRGDRATSFDIDLDNIFSGSVDAAFIAIDSGSAASSPWLGELRLRAAYGVGGDHAVLTADPGSSDPGSPAAAERRGELEAGIDALVLGNHRASVTYYRAMTKRGFEEFSLFGGPVLTNSARVRTWGVEGSLDARLLAVGSFVWDAEGIISVHRSEIEHLGGPPRFIGNQYYAPGESIGAYFGAPYTFSDVNADGLIAPNEVVVLDDEFGPVGSPFPMHEAALHTRMTFGGRLHLSAVLDRRAGSFLYNATARVRCRTLCEVQHDPTTPLEAQSRSVAATSGTRIAYLQDADYTKLREVRVALTLPSRIARLGGASSARISLTGRNLYTWTSYEGLDPEVISARYDGVGASDDFFQPTLRTFTARLDLVW